MKRLIATLSVVMMSLVGYARDGVKLTVASASTNAAAISSDISTSTLSYSKCIDSIIVDLTTVGGSPTCTVAVVSATTGQTILSYSATTSDAVFYPRALADTTAGVDIAGAAVPICLYGEAMSLKAYALNTTNSTVAVTATIVFQ